MTGTNPSSCLHQIKGWVIVNFIGLKKIADDFQKKVKLELMISIDR